jgi:iron complex outermembrane receptor protein
VRDDHFSDFGNTFNPKASFRYEPMKILMFRGSANTGFRAPTLFDRYGYRTAGANGTTRPSGTIRPCARAARRAWPAPANGAAGPGRLDRLQRQLPQPGRQQPRLQPEKSKGAWTLGAVIEPVQR